MVALASCALYYRMTGMITPVLIAAAAAARNIDPSVQSDQDRAKTA